MNVRKTSCLLRSALALGFGMLICSCARTEMTAFQNPQFVGHRFTTVLVEGGFSDLGQRQYAEDQTCEYLGDYADVSCIQSLKVFFPAQTYSQQEIKDTLARLRADGLLFLRPTGSSVTSVYIPPTSYTTGQASVVGNTVYGSSTTQTVGGGTLFAPNASFQAILYVVPSDKVAWYGTANSQGNVFAKWDDLIESAAEETAKKLVDEGALRPAPDD